MPIRKSLPATRAASDEFDWKDLEVLLEVARSESMSQAAARLKTRQPTVSRAIADLEARLGVKLIVRARGGKHPIALTEAGLRVVEKASGIERLIDAIYRDVSKLDQEAAGEVSLLCPDGIGTYFLAPALAKFQGAFPEIRLDVLAKPAPDREADISIQFLAEKPRMSDVAISLGWQHYAHFASKDYLDVYGGMSDPTDAVHHRMLSHHDHKEQKPLWQRKMVELQAILDPVLRTDCGPLLMNAVANGAGVAALPTYAALLDSRLVMLDTGERARAQFWLVCDHERSQTPRFKETISWIKALFDPRDNPWFREEFIPPCDFEAAKRPVANRRNRAAP